MSWSQSKALLRGCGPLALSNHFLLTSSAAMVPFCAFVYSHSRGMTGRVVHRIVQSPLGVYGLLGLPFVTLGMEKCIYDTVQAAQGINPKIRPADRGGFPSGGAELPSFSLIPVQERRRKRVPEEETPLLRRLTKATLDSITTATTTTPTVTSSEK